MAHIVRRQDVVPSTRCQPLAPHLPFGPAPPIAQTYCYDEENSLHCSQPALRGLLARSIGDRTIAGHARPRARRPELAAARPEEHGYIGQAAGRFLQLRERRLAEEQSDPARVFTL